MTTGTAALSFPLRFGPATGWPARLALVGTLVASASLSGQDASPGRPVPRPPAVEPAPVVKVFILAGQSNMEGQAVVDLDHPQHYNGGRGTLARLLEDPRTSPLMGHLRDKDGEWSVRRDVWCWYRAGEGANGAAPRLKSGPLSIGFAVYDGRHHFGPELEFGHVLGDALEEPVLLIKACWGGKSLYRDFRPPSAGGEPGLYYRRMFGEVRECLDRLAEYVPAYAAHRTEIAGFVWFQGWNDMFDDAAVASYEQNLVHLIGDVRRELGQSNLPVVVGETGNGDNTRVRNAQRAATKSPDLGGDVTFVPTFQHRRAKEQSPNVGHGHHWFGNAESYFLIGRDLGHAMVKLLKKSARSSEDEAGKRSNPDRA